jgi:hypothetical protein
MRCNSSSASSATEIYTKFLDVTRKKNREDSGLANNLAKAQCNQPQGNFWGVNEMGWCTLMHEPCYSLNIHRDIIQ